MEDLSDLLKSAAKAAGYELVALHGKDYCAYALASDPLRLWNPIESSGEAFALAVRLKMDVQNSLWGECVVEIFREDIGEYGDYQRTYVLHNDDPFAATRKAIVMAAAKLAS